MSKDPIDKTLSALHFENYRLGFKPNQTHAKILESAIQRLESQPVEDSGDDLDTTLHHLKTLKQDLVSIQEVVVLAIQLHNLRDQIRENGFLLYRPDDAEEVLNEFHAWFEKMKIEQRKRQWRNFASLRHFWPQADWERKRAMVELFATNSRRRLEWGTLNLRIALPLRIGRWASRMCRKF